jgi:hypothetical protein
LKLEQNVKIVRARGKSDFGDVHDLWGSEPLAAASANSINHKNSEAYFRFGTALAWIVSSFELNARGSFSAVLTTDSTRPERPFRGSVDGSSFSGEP